METHVNTTDPNQTRKFLFDLSFDDEVGSLGKKSEKPKPTYSQEQLDEAKQEAYAAGFAEGQRSMQESQQQSLNLLMANVEERLAQVMSKGEGVWQGLLAQCQEIALVIAHKIMPSFTARHGMDEIESIVSRVMAEMGREPRLVFRVPESQFDDAKARIENIARQAAYAGKLVILGDPDLGVSDCRIEWADGGIERDIGKLWQSIDKIMEDVQTGTLVPPSSEEVTAPEKNVAAEEPVTAAPTPVEEPAEKKDEQEKAKPDDHGDES